MVCFVWNSIKKTHSLLVQRYNSLFNSFPFLEKTFFTIGSLYLFSKFGHLLYGLTSQMCKFDLKQRYGPDSWVVVTGGSDGIGKSFCYYFAQHGFNVCIVSRTLEKMKVIAKDLEEKYQISTKIIQANFENGNSLAFYEQIVNQLQELDVSVLVNNVGIAPQANYLEQWTDKDVNDVLVVNTLSTVFMTKFMIERLLSRQYHSAVITISSMLGHFSAPYVAPYCGSKAFQDQFSQSLRNEYSGSKIDFISGCPGAVATGIFKSNKMKFFVTPDDCVLGIMNDLRRKKSQTWGAFRHKWMIWRRFQSGSQKQVRATQMRWGTMLKNLNN